MQVPWVTGSTGLAQNRSYTYDLNGNRLSKTIGTTTTTYGYDRTNQLSSINGSTSLVAYNGTGSMTKKRDDADPSSTTSYTYDLAGKLTGIDGDDAGEAHRDLARSRVEPKHVPNTSMSRPTGSSHPTPSGLDCDRP